MVAAYRHSAAWPTPMAARVSRSSWKARHDLVEAKVLLAEHGVARDQAIRQDHLAGVGGVAVVQRMEAPQRVEPVVGVVGQPVRGVHGHDRERDQQPARPVLGLPQLDPLRVPADQGRRPDAEQRHQRDHHVGDRRCAQRRHHRMPGRKRPGTTGRVTVQVDRSTARGLRSHHATLPGPDVGPDRVPGQRGPRGPRMACRHGW